MLVPIKKIILEVNNPLKNVGFPASLPMGATRQSKELIKSGPELEKRIPPENNGTLINAKTKATDKFKPNDLTKKIILTQIKSNNK